MSNLSNECITVIRDSILNKYNTVASNTDIEFIEDTLSNYLNIGFDRFNDASATEWKKVKAILDIACDDNLARMFRKGNSRAFYISTYDSQFIIESLLSKTKILDLILSYVDKYYTFGFEQICFNLEL